MVRVRTDTLDRFLGTVGEVILSSSQLRTAVSGFQHSAGAAARLDQMERTVAELQRRVLDLRTTPLRRVMETLPRAARRVAERAGVRVEVEIQGAELELDRSILDRLSEPLLHLVRNAVDHGIEPPSQRQAAGKPAAGRIGILATRTKDSIEIEVRDDGAGIDFEAVRRRAVSSGLIHADLAEDLTDEATAGLVFQPGLSTAAGVSEVSGRGVGMDAVKTVVESLGGHVELRSQRGAGSSVTLRVPITAAVQRVLLVALAGERVALPISRVERILEVPAEAIERSGGESFVLIDDVPVPAIELAACLGIAAGAVKEGVCLALVVIRGERVALRVDRFAGQQEIYVKPVPELLGGIRVLAGLTVLGDGSPVFLLDPNHLA